MTARQAREAGKALMALDAAAHEAVADVRESPAVKVIGTLSEIGDQAQMRLLAGGIMVAGLVRKDSRLALAGARMLVSHELATAMKNAVKKRVDRTRPRSAGDGEVDHPSHGHNRGKEETSFPSGHSAGATASASAFASVYPEYRGPALASAGAVALAQIPRCAHYPTDVGAGIAIGAVADLLVGFGFRLATRILR